MQNHRKKSFTLIELIVTTAIIIILAAITFGVYSAYRSSARLDLATQDLHDVILNIRTLASAPDDPDATNYILYINTNPTETRTPAFQSLSIGNQCLHLEANGGYCIMKEKVTSGNRIVGIVGFTTHPLLCPGFELLCLPEGYQRVGVLKGKINLGGSTISADETSGWQVNIDASCQPDTDCGWANYCNRYYYPGVGCHNVNEEDIVKIHFRTWDGAVGINGLYNDINAESWMVNEVTFTFTYGDTTKTLTLNLNSGSMQIQ